MHGLSVEGRQTQAAAAANELLVSSSLKAPGRLADHSEGVTVVPVTLSPSAGADVPPPSAATITWGWLVALVLFATVQALMPTAILSRRDVSLDSQGSMHVVLRTLACGHTAVVSVLLWMVMVTTARGVAASNAVLRAKRCTFFEVLRGASPRTLCTQAWRASLREVTDAYRAGEPHLWIRVHAGTGFLCASFFTGMFILARLLAHRDSLPTDATEWVITVNSQLFPAWYNLAVSVSLYALTSWRLRERRAIITAAIDMYSDAVADALPLGAGEGAGGASAAVEMKVAGTAGPPPPRVAALVPSAPSSDHIQRVAAELAVAETWRSALEAERMLLRTHLDLHPPSAPVGWVGVALQALSALAAVTGLLAHLGLIPLLGASASAPP